MTLVSRLDRETLNQNCIRQQYTKRMQRFIGVRVWRGCRPLSTTAKLILINNPALLFRDLR